MKRRSFLRNSAMATGALGLSLPAVAAGFNAGPGKNLIEWRVYHVSRNSDSRGRLNRYFKDALAPFLQKRNVQFAVFSEYGKSEPVILYTMMGYPDQETYFNCLRELETDPGYLDASREFFSAPSSQAAYIRYETFLLEAFDGFPKVKMPEGRKDIFEMRLYESASEEAGKRKVGMFNKEEIAVFLETGINPVFFGKIIAGQYMPALLYLVAFNDMADRDASWSKFSNHPDWITMREKPEYADTVSNIQRIFLVLDGYYFMEPGR